MLNVVAALRQANHARLARRRDRPSGWLTRLVRRIRAKNRDRLARRRAQRQLPASLVANDTAVLEALVFLIKTAREEQKSLADAHAAVLERLGAVEALLARGVERLEARLDALQARPPPVPARAADGAGAPVAPVGARPLGIGGTGGNGASAGAAARVDTSGEQAGPTRAAGIATEPFGGWRNHS